MASNPERENWADTSKLPADLHDELTRLEQDFKVDARKLKEIIKRFEEELREGLDRNGANIVRLESSQCNFEAILIMDSQ